MRVSVSQAKGQLTELVRRAETGEEVLLTRHGRPVVRCAQSGFSVRRRRPAAVIVLDTSALMTVVDGYFGDSALNRSEQGLLDKHA